jgi:hypothetical protein
MLITGAGASREFGVGGRPLPIMSEWAGSLCAALDATEANLAQALGLRPDMSGQEFEATLGKFFHLGETLERVREFVHLGGPNGQPLAGPGHILTWANQVEMRRPQVRDCIARNLWEEFGINRIDLDAATEAFRSLVVAIGVGARRNTKLISATTNYDRMQEHAYSFADPERLSCDIGLRRASPAASGYLDANAPLADLEVSVITHLHLHGAVGWYRDGSRVRIDGADQPLQPGGDPAVLYPDPDKDPTSSEGHDALWRAFHTAMVLATDVIVIGHSLNDQPIVDEIVAARDARLAVCHRNNDASLGRAHAQLAQLGLEDRATLVPLDFGPSLDVQTLAEWVETAGD